LRLLKAPVDIFKFAGGESGACGSWARFKTRGRTLPGTQTA
jgi:hypothetical protein